MPRLIDHDARTREIAAASLRVLERDGLAGLSVRGVADEAGIAVASLRRTFPTQHALREHCLLLIDQRVSARIAGLGGHFSGRRLAEEILKQLLPLDHDRRVELLAQIQLGVLALTDARLHDSVRRLNRGVAAACRACIELLREAGDLGAGRDPGLEAERLHALLDGAALHAVWGGDDDAEAARRLVVAHLDDIARRPR
ncbi:MULTISPECIES: TetR/AcrR family transcriptional regulator [Microbacterium]|uniref:TetR family transcriptional regulator n=1 Tax=Microbacterium hominis TaxID=162426 RepID=A0A2K9D6P9_9MICO|nr:MULTISPECIES: TetR family transcriptional regulator C-terminal domain-containing protein [Microbacterium]AUG28552.1 TetR family transcriptional regulator [Microbacterium hominis]